MKVPKISTVLAVSCAAGLVGSALLNAVQYQRAQQDKKLLQGEITDLRYELNLERDGGATPTPSPTAKTEATATPAPDATPTPAPEVAGTASVSVPPYGLKITVSGNLIDLQANKVRSGTRDVAGFTTAALLAKYPKCTAGPALGTLVQRSNAENAPAYNQKVKTIGSFTYYYSTGELADCATDADGKAAVAAARTALVAALSASLAP